MKASCVNCKWYDKDVCSLDKCPTSIDNYCLSWESNTVGPLPEGQAAVDAMKAALWKRANGYTYEQRTTISGSKGDMEVVKTIHVPGDIKAMAEYIKIFGG